MGDFSGEDITDAAIASLKAQLPAVLAVINAAHDDFEIEAPADHAYKAGGDFLHESYPHIEVATPDEDFIEPDISLGSWIGGPRVVVRATLQDFTADGGEALYRKLQRLALAILRTLTYPGAFGPGITVLRAAKRVRFDPEAGEHETVTGGVLCLFQLQRAVTRD